MAPITMAVLLFRAAGTRLLYLPISAVHNTTGPDDPVAPRFFTRYTVRVGLQYIHWSFLPENHERSRCGYIGRRGNVPLKPDYDNITHWRSQLVPRGEWWL